MVSTDAHELCGFLGCQGLSVPRLLVYIEILYHRCHIANQSICQHILNYVFQSDELQSDSPFLAQRLTLSTGLRAVNGCSFVVVLAVMNKPHSHRSVQISQCPRHIVFSVSCTTMEIENCGDNSAVKPFLVPHVCNVLFVNFPADVGFSH